MIRFSAALVAVAIGVLIGGIATSKLLLVYIAIVVSAVALVALAIGVVLKREELFGRNGGLCPLMRAPAPFCLPLPTIGAAMARSRRGRAYVRHGLPLHSLSRCPRPAHSRARQAGARPTRRHPGKPSPRKTRGRASSLSQPRQAGRPPTATAVSRGRRAAQDPRRPAAAGASASGSSSGVRGGWNAPEADDAARARQAQGWHATSPGAGANPAAGTNPGAGASMARERVPVRGRPRRAGSTGWRNPRQARVLPVPRGRDRDRPTVAGPGRTGTPPTAARTPRPARPRARQARRRPAPSRCSTPPAPRPRLTRPEPRPFLARPGPNRPAPSPLSAASAQASLPRKAAAATTARQATRPSRPTTRRQSRQPPPQEPGHRREEHGHLEHARLEHERLDGRRLKRERREHRRRGRRLAHPLFLAR